MKDDKEFQKKIKKAEKTASIDAQLGALERRLAALDARK